MPLAPRKVVTWDKLQRIYRNHEIWQQKDSIVHRLPEHFKWRYWRNLLSDRQPVHYEPPKTRYEWDPVKNERVENEHYPILPMKLPIVDQGLWGGEGVLKGYYLGKWDRRLPKGFWKRDWYPFYRFPMLAKEPYYSEILDRHMLIMTTRRARILIDENQGIDCYILRTPEIDLDSKLANKLKREMMLSLARGADFHTDEKRRRYILEKYAEFVVPESEAEWISLDLNAACRKQQDIEDKQAGNPVPLKVRYEKETVARLKGEPTDEPQSVESEGTLKRFWKRLRPSSA